MAAEIAESYGSEAGTSYPGYISQEVFTSTLASFTEAIQSQVPGLNQSLFMPQFWQSSQQAPSTHSQQTPTAVDHTPMADVQTLTAGVHTPTPGVHTPTGGQQTTPNGSQTSYCRGPSQSADEHIIPPSLAEYQRQQSISRRGGGKKGRRPKGRC